MPFNLNEARLAISKNDSKFRKIYNYFFFLNFWQSQSHTLCKIKLIELECSKKNTAINVTRLLVSGRSPECSDRLLKFMEQ